MRSMTDPEHCGGCRYAVQVDVGLDSEMMLACVYILRKAERRPCPAGAACTMYEPMTEEDYKRRRPNYELLFCL